MKESEIKKYQVWQIDGVIGFASDKLKYGGCKRLIHKKTTKTNRKKKSLSVLRKMYFCVLDDDWIALRFEQKDERERERQRKWWD